MDDAAPHCLLDHAPADLTCRANSESQTKQANGSSAHARTKCFERHWLKARQWLGGEGPLNERGHASGAEGGPRQWCRLWWRRNLDVRARAGGAERAHTRGASCDRDGPQGERGRASCAERGHDRSAGCGGDGPQAWLRRPCKLCRRLRSTVAGSIASHAPMSRTIATAAILAQVSQPAHLSRCGLRRSRFS